MEYPTPEYLTEFSLYLQAQGKAEGTIRVYIRHLQNVDDDIEAYFANPNLRGKHSKRKP